MSFFRKVLGLETQHASADAAKTWSERRAAPRYGVCDATRLFVTRRPLSTVVVDVSAAGARFATRMPRDVGTVVGLELSVGHEPCVVPVRILWDRWTGAYYEHGGTFVDLDGTEQAHVHRYISSADETPTEQRSERVARLLASSALQSVTSSPDAE